MAREPAGLTATVLYTVFARFDSLAGYQCLYRIVVYYSVFVTRKLQFDSVWRLQIGAGYVRKDCENCGATHHNKRFCSQGCSGQYKSKQKFLQSLQSGILPSHPVTAKNYLKRIRSASCEICGLTEWLGKEILLILDHENGNSQDWSLENLRLVCSNCDAQLPTYKFKNKGNGRFIRQQRYRDGLSH